MKNKKLSCSLVVQYFFPLHTIVLHKLEETLLHLPQSQMRIFQLYDCFKKNMLMAFAFRPNSAAFALSSWHFGRTDDEIPGQRKHTLQGINIY